MKEAGSNYAYGLYANTNGNRPSANAVTGGTDHDLRGTASLATSAWTHVAMTYDGTALRLFVNGTQVATEAAAGSIATSTGALRIGGNGISPEWYAGLVDEVRLYNRALTATEIQADMNRSVGTPDTQAPAAPTNLTATGGLGQAALAWTAATDNVGIARYNVHRSTTAGLYARGREPHRAADGYELHDSGLAAATYYYKVTAQDGSSNVSPSSNEASASVTADTSSPTTPANLAATGGAGQAALSWNASTDNVGVVRYNLHRSTSSGFTPSATSDRIAQPTGTGFTDSGLGAGTYYYKVTAEDASGNMSGASAQASASVTTAAQFGSGALAAARPTPSLAATLQEQQPGPFRRSLDSNREDRYRPELRRGERLGYGRRLGVSRSHERDDA